MKIKYWMLAAMILFITHAQAAPITVLMLGDSDITVGDQFSVQVRIDNDVINEELLAFGFDLQGIDPLLNYAGVDVAPAFTDTSFGMNNVAGLAFPGINDMDILLATLMFDALDAGVAQISVQGLFDGLFSGLFYEFSGFDISAQTSVIINQRASSIPEPEGLFGVVAGMIVLLCLRKNRSN